MSLVAASSLGKWPLARTARRSLAFKASIAFVTGMRIVGAKVSAVGEEPAAYGATIRDRGAGSTKVWAGRSRTMSRELELVAGRLCDLPGCAASANP